MLIPQNLNQKTRINFTWLFLKEWILNEEQRIERKNYIEQNRRKRREMNRRDSDKSVDSVNLTQESIPNQEFIINENMDSEVSNELTEEDISKVEEVIKIDEIIDKAHKTYKECGDASLSRSIVNYDKKFNEMEQYKLNELFMLMLNLKYDTDSRRTMRDYSKSLDDLLIHNSMFYEQKGLRLIDTIKMINAFESINEADKLTLVTHGGIEILILRSLQFYNSKKEAWIVPIVFIIIILVYLNFYL